MEHIKMIEFELRYTENLHGVYVALFDNRKVTEKEIKDEISLYPQGYHKNIVFMSKEQFENVFETLIKKQPDNK